ncbi:MAG: hypothetical protein EBZ47_02335 [Chlamydiae bacterium]|nr:hypothetical protein [Chlamydiota bacterium]
MSSGNYKKSFSKRSKKPLLFFLTFCIASLLFFKDRVACSLLDFWLTYRFNDSLQKSLHIGAKKNNHGHLYIEELKYLSDEMEIYIPSASVYTSIHLFPFHITTYVDCQDPQIKIVQQGSNSSKLKTLGSIFPRKFFSLKLNIPSGSIELPSQACDPFYFSVDSKAHKGHIADFSLTQKEMEVPLCLLTLDQAEKSILAHLEFQSSDLSRLNPFLKWIQISEKLGVNEIQGELKADVLFVLDPGIKISSIKANIDIENLKTRLGKKEIGLSVPSCKMLLNYPTSKIEPENNKLTPFWKQMDTQLEVTGANICFHNEIPISFSNIESKIISNSCDEPTIKVTSFIEGAGRRFPCEISSSGVIQTDGSFWWQSDVLLKTSPDTNATLTLSLCKVEDDKYILQTDLHNIDDKLLSFFGDLDLWSAQLALEASAIEGSGLVWIEKKTITRLEWNHLHVENCRILLADQVIGSESFFSQGILKKNEAEWQFLELEAEVKDGYYHKKTFDFYHSFLSLKYKNHKLEPSTFSTQCNQGNLLLSACGPITNIHSKVDVNTSWSSLISLFKGHSEFDQNVDVKACFDLRLKGSQIDIIGDSIFFQDQDKSNVHLALHVPVKICSLPWNTQCNYSMIKARIQSENIFPTIYFPLISFTPKDISISGNIGMDLDITHGRAKGSLSSEDLFLSHGGIALSTGLFTKEDANFEYDFVTGSFSMGLGLHDAYFAHESSKFCLSNICGNFQWKDFILKSEKITSVCEGISIPFSIFYDAEGFAIKTFSMETKIENLCKIDIIKRVLGSYEKNIKGIASIHDGGCSALIHNTDSGWKWHYKLSIMLSDVDVALGNQNSICKASTEFSFDSSSMLTTIKKMKGSLSGWGGVYAIALDDFTFDPKKDNKFYLEIADARSLLLTLGGKVSLFQDVVIQFDKETCSLLSIPVQIENCKMKKDLTIRNVDISLQFTEKARKECITRLDEVKLLSTDLRKWLHQNNSLVHGEFAIQANYSENMGVALEVYCEQLSWKDIRYHRCELSLRYDFLLWTVEKLGWNTSYVKAKLFKDADSLQIMDAVYEGPFGYIDLKGVYQIATRTLHVEKTGYSFSSQILPEGFHVKGEGSVRGVASCYLTLNQSFLIESLHGTSSINMKILNPLALDILSAKDIQFIYEPVSGFCIKNADLNIFSKNSKEIIGKISWDLIKRNNEKNGWEIKQSQVALYPKATLMLASSGLVESPLCLSKEDLQWKFSGDIRFSEEALEAVLQFSSGYYLISGQKYELFNPTIQISSSSIHARTQLMIAKKKIFCDLQKEFSLEAPIYLLLRPDLEAEGVKIICKEKDMSLSLQRIEGKFFGFEVNLQKSLHAKDSYFFGSIKLDASSIDLIPSEIADIIKALKMGQKYQLKGHFTFPGIDDQTQFSFKGDIRGEKSEFLGYTLDSIFAKAQINPSRVILEDIKFEDVCGNLSIKSCQIIKDEFLAKWSLEMPLGHVREFKPSLLAVKGKRDQEKPFNLKNFSVYDLTGTIGDLKSFKGKGALYFLNSQKREFSFLNIPLEVIKDLGLDTSILAPISGEADFCIQKGRCLFLELKNSYSEGRRSEFFLSGDSLAYIDFEGNWHVDLKMKQHVLLKWSQSLLVSIRGTLEKPKYSLKNVEAGL